jgi:hypothetical protein
MWVGRAEEVATGVRDLRLADHPARIHGFRATGGGKSSSLDKSRVKTKRELSRLRYEDKREP